MGWLRRRREQDAAALARVDAELNGTAVRIHCLDCSPDAPDYDGTYPLAGDDYESWARTHAGHAVAMTLDGDRLPNVVMPGTMTS